MAFALCAHTAMAACNSLKGNLNDACTFVTAEESNSILEQLEHSFDGVDTTFVYKAGSTGCPGLSHWTLALPPCACEGDYVKSASPAGSMVCTNAKGTNFPKDGTGFGYKWETSGKCGDSTGACNYTIVLRGEWMSGVAPPEDSHVTKQGILCTNYPNLGHPEPPLGHTTCPGLTPTPTPLPTDPVCPGMPPCVKAADPINVCEGGNDGKPNNMTLKYVGGSCDDSHNNQGSLFSCTGAATTLSPAYIVISNKNTVSDTKASIWFQGWVDLNAELTMISVDTFPANSYAYIMDGPNGNIIQNPVFHTSCSAPLLLGDRYGALELVGYKSPVDQTEHSYIAQLQVLNSTTCLCECAANLPVCLAPKMRNGDCECSCPSVCSDGSMPRGDACTCDHVVTPCAPCLIPGEVHLGGVDGCMCGCPAKVCSANMHQPGIDTCDCVCKTDASSCGPTEMWSIAPTCQCVPMPGGGGGGQCNDQSYVIDYQGNVPTMRVSANPGGNCACMGFTSSN